MVNNCTFSGTIGSDPKTRQAGNYTIANFSIAVYMGKDKEAMWVSCDVWGKRADTIMQYYYKGGKVTVCGEVSLNEYNGKTTLKLNVKDFDLPPKSGGQSSGGQTQQQAQEPFLHDEIPF